MRFLPLAFFVVIFSSILTSCTDPCIDLDCQNGSVCIDGTCACDAGFRGKICQEEIRPTTVKINKITIKDFPELRPNGSTWDESDGPDIGIKLFADDILVYHDEFFYENATPSMDFVYEYDPILEFTDIFKLYEIRLYDITGFLLNPDLMDIAPFSLYVPGDKFPETVTVYGSNEMVAEISLEYIFN